MPEDYNNTLNLPKTAFPMRAGLPQKEPELLKKWEEQDFWNALMRHNEGKPLFVLHDGPPYANGDIHLGTAMNKILKDFIMRYKNMSGFKAPYVPGWDTHGLPIERKAIDKVGLNRRSDDPAEFRGHCRDFALSHIEVMTEQFKRLGVIGDWKHPYRTLNPAFEARQIEVFGEMALKGYIYKGLKPVYWCPHDETALAEAEIEYAEDPCDSVYVKFEVTDDHGKLYPLGAKPGSTYFIIWTTTTWTLPGNVAICLGPEFDYALVRAGDSCYVVAAALAEKAMQAGGVENYEVLGTIPGAELEGITAKHPFLDRQSLVIVGGHVTLESGTGCVHTAPGHGVEDFEVCRNYPQLPIVVPVDDKGRLTKDAGPFEGLTTDKANKAIREHLAETGALFATEHITHQYPHCWRCKHPVLFRATEQWFCSVDDIKEKTFEAIRGVEWLPAWGEERITGMVRDRSDWCISRQRLWGVPIPIFYCKDCGKELITRESIDAVAALFRKEGADAWWKYSAEEILPGGTVCSCGGHAFAKEQDVMDVWFDSGVTHAAVLATRPDLHWPADIYLEGNDQYRGWFQSSLLTSIAWKGVAPYKMVITHGMVVDGEGRKMSKSLGNGIAPGDIVKKFGADILRLWVASSDYQGDVRVSDNILKQLSEVYRKIRNTARYILGNTSDFDPQKDAVAFDALLPIDKWAVWRLDELQKTVVTAYEHYEFHTIFHAVHNFCVVDMSNFYLDVLKDRLYVEKADSVSRRAAQTVIHRILDSLTRLVAPILVFTAEEIWQYLPHDAEQESVLYAGMPSLSGESFDEAFTGRWERIHTIRDDVKKALELSRTAHEIGGSLEAEVTLYAAGELYDFLQSVVEELPAVFIVSGVHLEKEGTGAFQGDVEGLSVTVAHAHGEKCERCWVYSDTVGQSTKHPTLCSRCAGIVE
ncbi:isoleucine--tRNA ligase [Ethanoligenens harbinense]|uniref:Isoleucine--tRNA ligase n=1 Tax=Ethanoligenens harbinense (strain DSM 18485 / JCM 12961 / CGMCC 1.5033 / YUAN-3) TaxID=663278 RepID=E6U2H9_ETHHY|nr:isoleucine--tRNA ligase [Ethanoligenens harbinense]ADU26270.1 isoleucyl-tRNA synthetase [Ethanoligenens harbinense YUAN-3]AVQ95404.1 isoleucine--tRNA ligase [Ethanoligenens harbinense YUAN-3]AYF38069.1 isoleucine--tRNA ligase [Ethanoligenens harbinense]AYF40814.1 isoleucine--tRNA ligase [Ethanoligenens harbinense]QCN91645.1 isoleucine--tRNA ligase [Ethanoligenens harbinense]